MTKGVGEGRRGYWDRQLAAAHRTSGGCLEWAGYRSSAGYVNGMTVTKVTQ